MQGRIDECGKPQGSRMRTTNELIIRGERADLSPDAVRLLRAFSTSANRAGLHPNDRRRWNAFLIRVHQDESLFDPALLDEWLQQEGWPEETRGQLVGEYEAARSLLSAYDEEAERR